MASEGWGWPSNSRKAHYFVGRISLCGRWAFSGNLAIDEGTHSPDDCTLCARRLNKRRLTPSPSMEGKEEDHG